MNKWDFLKIIIGLILIIYIIWGVVEPEKLLDAFVNLDILFLGLGIIAYFVLDLVWAMRLYLSIKWIGLKLSFRESFWTHLFGMFWSNITPGRAGYVSIIYSLNEWILKKSLETFRE